MYFAKTPRVLAPIVHESRQARCIGWHCLTAAEQFGIIFSSVVVFLVFSLVYMYCLGRACIANKDRQASRLDIAKHSRVSSHGHRRPATPLVWTPTTQNQLVVRPAMAGQQALGLRQVWSQPYTNPVIYHGVPLVPLAFTASATQPAAAYQQPIYDGTSDPAPSRPPSCARDTFTANTIRSKSPGWRRRLNQILQLPLGRASTIHTDSGPASPKSIRQDHCVFRQESGSNHSVRKKSQAKRQSHRAGKKTGGLETSSAEVASIRSTAATVRSDDFELISPASSLDSQPGVKTDVDGGSLAPSNVASSLAQTPNSAEGTAN
ncbi:hypothetical protein VFPPC_02898 [Pochonia chlamydosporia 170]|uniref:Uncharacterized protein n=1 Tax=Pochonia chlamydosporia 170 TaxID=1380566 RepID=A0A179FXR3_METCM|nr:hypothetical protein VFPPC_02898 [Pochonia chlamydosporia 170]OAQ70422.1 hypothetical protein VFPPC_02898 [Pochonia chlamydosporia 170]